MIISKEKRMGWQQSPPPYIHLRRENRPRASYDYVQKGVDKYEKGLRKHRT